MKLTIALAIGLTFVLGCITALAFVLIGGRLALQGPYAIERSWPLIYPLVAAFAAAVLFVVGCVWGTRLSVPRLAVVVLGAWLGQYLVLASGILDDDLNPYNAVYFWLLATGGPLQPAAAFVGGWLGLYRWRAAGVEG